jgi:hypothetical protein
MKDLFHIDLTQWRVSKVTVSQYLLWAKLRTKLIKAYKDRLNQIRFINNFTLYATKLVKQEFILHYFVLLSNTFHCVRIFFNLPNPPSLSMNLGLTQSNGMSTRNLPCRGGGKGRPAPKADNLTAACEDIV